MSARATSSQFLNDVAVKEIVFGSSSEKSYHKGVPQTDFPMLGLGAREDGSGAHCYLYQNKGEVFKRELNWSVPKDCLFSREVSPGSPVALTTPESTSTFSALAIGAPDVRARIDRREHRLTITTDRPAKVFLALFEGTYLDWRPIPTNRYAESGPYPLEEP